MRKHLLTTLFAFATIPVLAQQATSYFVISPAADPNRWVNLKQMNTSNASESVMVYEHQSQQTLLRDAYTNRIIPVKKDPTTNSNFLSAALGYDATHRQLFYIPMYLPELRWTDLSNPSSPSYFSIRSNALEQLNLSDPGSQVTRMTVGADGFAYALTNDGKHLFRISTGRQPQITDLGGLIDANSNKEISVHNPCAGWGGDLIAVADGNLILITQSGQVFRFHPGDRIARFSGQIKNLPAGFSANGAAVDENGEVLISCSIGNRPLYRFNLETLEAVPQYQETKTQFNFSDMASGHFAFRKKTPVSAAFGAEWKKMNISIYPNPVTEGYFQIQFETNKPGTYTVQLMDIAGRSLTNKQVAVAEAKQITYMETGQGLAKGVYLVKVNDPDKQTVYSGKIVIQ